MNLSDEEKKILGGAKGPLLAEALQGLVHLGEAFGAARLIDIQYAHIDAGLAFLEGHYEHFLAFARAGIRVAVPTTTNAVCLDLERWRAMGAPESLARKQLAIAMLHRRLGIASVNSCAPYLMGFLPPRRSHVASVESSAVIYFNSLLGCRTNRCGQMAFYSALTGKYPLCGYHLDSYRRGTHRILCKCRPQSPTDWGALGFAIGEKIGEGVPVLSGLGPPSSEDLVALGAALATTGLVSLFHIPGITAEARTAGEVLAGGRATPHLHLTPSDLTRVFERFGGDQGEKVDFVHLGCPHYSLEQVRRAAFFLEGKKIKDGVRCWICTAPGIREMARRMGYLKIIEDAGSLLLTDTCPVVSPLRQDLAERLRRKTPTLRVMVTDSVKQAKYARDLIGCKVILAQVEEALRAAVQGRWSR